MSATLPTRLTALPGTAPPSVLIVIAEPTVQALVAQSLAAAGLFAMRAGSAAEGRRLAGEVRPDALVVDLDAPQAAELAQASDLPRVLLSARPGADEPPLALRLAKPLVINDLLQALGRLLRPQRAAARSRSRMRLKAGPFEVDGPQRLVRWRGPQGWRPLDLTDVERRLLQQLLTRPGSAHSREAIAAGVWGDREHDLRTVDQCIKRLRRSLQAAGAPDLITTVRGVGYRLSVDGPAPGAVT
jgi:DNA-binding response OmpR family regulator